MTSAERRALDGSSIYPVARARNVCFCQRPPRERERTREKEIILALARNYATIQVLNAYNLFRVATARVSHRPVSERRGGRGKIGEQRGWRVHAHTACSPVISRRVRKRSTHTHAHAHARRNRISKREISNALLDIVVIEPMLDHNVISYISFLLAPLSFFLSFFSSLDTNDTYNTRITRTSDTLVNFDAKRQDPYRLMSIIANDRSAGNRSLIYSCMYTAD